MLDNRFVCVPIPREMYNELVMRRGTPKVDVATWIQTVVQDYLDRTAADAGWTDAFYEWHSTSQDLEGFREQFGDPAKGYHWGRVFLPNSTKISMTYKDRQYYAEVKHEQIYYEGATYSPSELASIIAGNTSRNAWRALLVKRPNDEEWILADVLRQQKRRLG